MDRERALAELRRLAVGLEANGPGGLRLLERASQADDPEALRAVLVELGAETLLDREARP
jgi:hypothetical protein